MKIWKIKKKKNEILLSEPLDDMFGHIWNFVSCYFFYCAHKSTAIRKIEMENKSKQSKQDRFCIEKKESIVHMFCFFFLILQYHVFFNIVFMWIAKSRFKQNEMWIWKIREKWKFEKLKIFSISISVSKPSSIVVRPWNIWNVNLANTDITLTHWKKEISLFLWAVALIKHINCKCHQHFFVFFFYFFFMFVLLFSLWI